MTEEVLNDLFDYDNLKIYQLQNGFKFSLDSILLSEFVTINNNTKRILDLCTGNASIPLILSTKSKASIDAFEIQEKISNLAEKSVDYNNLNNQIKIYNANIIDIDDYINKQKYDIITCNPPYFKIDEGSNLNISNEQRIARHEITITLSDIFKIASEHLNDKGTFYIVHRASRLDEIIITAHEYNLNVKIVQLIKTKEESKPYIVLIKCVKNSKFGVIIENEININNLKTYKNLFK